MRIGLSGTQSTGKTTLLNVLRSERIFKDYQVNDEVTRWVKSLNIEINEAGSDKSQELIMMKHLWNVIMYDNMITDRTALDVLVYSKWLFYNEKITETMMNRVEHSFQKIIEFYDHIFFLSPDFPLEDDGVRSTDEQWREEIHDMFLQEIEAGKVTVTPLFGSVTDRVFQILDKIEK